MTSKAKPPRLGLGALTTDAMTADAARLALLDALENMDPPIELLALRDDVLPLVGTESEAEALTAWAGRYHLDAEWILEQARETLRLWRLDPDIAPSWGVTGTDAYWSALSLSEVSVVIPKAAGDRPVVRRSRSVGEARITIRDQWLPEWETRTEVRDRVIAVLDARLDAIERLAVSRGLVPAKKMRSRKGPAGWAYTAFVLYRCRGEKHQAIAAQFRVSRERVVAAIGEISDLVDVPLRPAQTP